MDHTDEDDLNDGLDDGDVLCGGYTPRPPYYGPWNYTSRKDSVDYLVQAHKREITALKAHHEEKLSILKQNADLQMELVLMKLNAEHEQLKQENEKLRRKLRLP